ATGMPDTKFGLDIQSGAAEAGVRAILAQPALELRGFHAHIGSQITELRPYREAIDRVFAFAAAMREKTGFTMTEMSPGGGFAVRYVPDDPKLDPLVMVRDVAASVVSGPVAGAYQLAMSSNYNLAPRPAVVVVADADATLVRAREKYDDLIDRA